MEAKVNTQISEYLKITPRFIHTKPRLQALQNQ